MSIFNGLLFMHGHITNVELARQLAKSAETIHTANVGDQERARQRRERGQRRRASVLARVMTALSPFR
jgi:hypothetical protein